MNVHPGDRAPALPIPPPAMQVWGQKTASRRKNWSATPNVWENQVVTPASRQGNDIMHARYYAFNLGRFMSVDAFDPIKLQFGDKEDQAAFRRFILRSEAWNRYAYALNNPVRFRDSNGKSPGAGALVLPWIYGGGEAAATTGLGAASVGPAVLVLGAGAAGYGVGTAISRVPAVSEGVTKGFEWILDHTVNLAENTRQKQNRVNGLIAIAQRHLGKIASAGGPEKDPSFNHHKKEIKAFLSRAAKIAKKLPRKMREEAMKKILETAEKVGVTIE